MEFQLELSTCFICIIQAWNTVDNNTKFTAENYFGCCGFNSNDPNATDFDGWVFLILF